MQNSPDPVDVDEITRDAWMALGVATAAAFLVVIDVSVVNIALPSIAADFEASTVQLSWVISGYNISLASLLLLSGRLADRRGRRAMFTLGLWGFLAGSALSGLAPNVEFLIAARVIQAMGGALLTPASLAMVLPQFPLARRGTAIGLWGAMGALGAAFGPSVGAVLIEASDWRLIFLINVPLGIIVVAAARRLVPESRGDETTGALDLIGVPVGISGVALIMWGIVRSETGGWADPTVVSPIVLGLLLIPFVVWRSARHPSPLLDLSLFSQRSFSAAVAAVWVYALAFTAGFLLNSFMLQRLWGMSVLATGFAMTPGPIVGAATSTMFGGLADRVGHRWVVSAGAVAAAAAYLWLLVLMTDEQQFVVVFLPATLLLGLGVGATIAGLQSAAMSEIDPHQFASANATTRTVQQIGYAIGISVVLTLVADLDLAGFRAGYTWVVACFFASAVVMAVAYPSGSAATRQAHVNS
jgi:EmrB/QacA subfamily drug resistance transporter